MDIESFRRACAKYATGITITTLLDDAGTPHGMTINSFTSVSLEPLLVLVCVDLRANLRPLLNTGKHFGINVLSEEQKELSTRFSQKHDDRFSGVALLTGTTGVPLIRGALATFECVATKIVEAGDHIIVIGEVLHADHTDGRPLIYHCGKYQTLG